MSLGAATQALEWIERLMTWNEQKLKKNSSSAKGLETFILENGASDCNHG